MSIIEKLITSKTRVKLLETLLFNPEKEYHLRGISRKTDSNPSLARKELTRLMEIGLIKSKKKGNLILYQVNKESPIYNELKRIYIKTKMLGQALREKMENYSDIKYALIYGSFAEGTEKETSDIDLLVVGKIREKELHNATMKVEESIGREINYLLWTEKEFKEKSMEKIPLLTEVARGKIIMIKGDEDELRKTIESKQNKETGSKPLDLPKKS